MKQMVALALEEDLGPGDCTSESSVPQDLVHEGFILAKEQGIVAGIEVARHVFELVDQDVVFDPQVEDGSAVEVGDTILRLKGRARSILSGERLALNFMQRMSGVATMAHQATRLLEGTGAQVLDTRKTTPGLRAFEKWAVSLGGGANHRMGLYDMILIKDNHVDYAGSMSAALRGVKHYFDQGHLRVPVVVEVRSLEELREALTSSAQEQLTLTRLLLDNFTPSKAREAVEEVAGALPLEASGGIDLSTLRSYGEAGVDFVSMGALTHSVKSLDLSLKSQPHLSA